MIEHTCKSIVACGAFALFAGAAFADNVYIMDSNIAEDLSYPSDTIIFSPTKETGAIDYSISSGVTVEGNYINFNRGGNYTDGYVDINSIRIGEGSTLKAANSVTIGSNLGTTTSTGSTFDVGYSMYVNSSWTSTGDTVNAARGFYLQGGTQTIKELMLNESGGENGQTTFSGGSTVNISDSTLNLQGKLYVQGGANVTIQNSTTTLESHELSQISGGDLTVQGGKFTIINSYQYSPKAFTVSNGSLVIDGATADFRGVVLSTRSSNSKDAVITLKNGAVLDAGTMDLYTYDTNKKTTVFNIESGSTANVETFSMYGMNNRGGTINVNGGTLNVSDGLVQSETSGSYVYTTKLNVTNGGKADFAGSLDIASATVDGGTLIADSIIVGDGRSLTVAGDSVIEADLLSVLDTSTVSFGESAELNISQLEVVLSSVPVQTGTEFDLSDIFGENSSIVLAAVDNNVLMSDMDGNKYSAIVGEGGTVIVGSAVPEPSTYAAILGVIALAFATYRRRK